MNIAIMQPTFNPWIGYFDLIESVDLFVFLDHVQLEKRSWQTRNKLKINDQEFMVTIPIKKEGLRDNTTIKSATINDFIWAKKVIKTIENSYKKSKYYDEVFPFMQDILLKNNHTKLAAFNIYIINIICKKIGITTETITSSGFDKLYGQKDELLFDICTKVNATEYTSPPGSSNYLLENNAGERYSQSGISLFYQNYKHPTYPQLGKKFISHIGIFDLLFNVGFFHAKQTILSGHLARTYYKDFHENKQS